MKLLCEVLVPFDAARLSANATSGRHFGALTKMRRAAKRAANYAWLAQGSPSFDVAVVVDVVVRRFRVLDDDNLWAGLKAMRDALFKQAITPDDSPSWVRCGRITQETGNAWQGREEVLFRVYEDVPDA